MAWPDGVPQQTLELFEQKAKGLGADFSGKSLEEIASTIIKVTEGFKYEWGRSRAFGQCILFPWPHEVEQLGEVFCGTKALYRFLFAKFLKGKYNLPFDTVFLLGETHGSVGIFDKQKKYVLEDKPSEIYSGGSTELDLEETILLVNNIRSQNPLDILRNDQVIARSSREKVSDLTVQYDGKSVIFNIAHFNKPGATIGLWLKMTASQSGVDVKRFYYVCPGNYGADLHFDAEKCISHDASGSNILVPKEDALKCIALDVIYARALELKRKKKPGATVLGPEKAVDKIRNEEIEELRRKKEARRNKGNKNGYFGINNLINTENTYRIISGWNLGDSNEQQINHPLNSYVRNTHALFPESVRRQETAYSSINDYFEERFMDFFYDSSIRSREEIDHSLFVERFSKLPAGKLVQVAARLSRVSTQEELIADYFENFQQKVQQLRKDGSLRGCVQQLASEYLKRHGDASLTNKVVDEVMGVMFLSKPGVFDGVRESAKAQPELTIIAA